MDVYNAKFELLTPECVPSLPAAQCILAMVRGLVEVNRIYLAHHPLTPPLAASGVRYRRQTVGKDRWIDIPRILQTKEGSCEDLVAWRVAELDRIGEIAKPVIAVHDLVQPNGDPFVLYHVVCRRADGTLEDPSKQQGMDLVPFDIGG